MSANNKNGLSPGQVWGRKGGPALYLVMSVNATSGDASVRNLNENRIQHVANSVFDKLEQKR